MKQGNMKYRRGTQTTRQPVGYWTIYQTKWENAKMIVRDKSELNVDSQSLFPHLENVRNDTCVHGVV